jgi:thiol-disulfide isomerase/thioredoxin
VISAWRKAAILAAACATLAAAQQSLPFPGVQPQPVPQASALDQIEQQELTRALNESATSPLDMIRVLEAHLEKYPLSSRRRDIEVALAKAAIDNKDDARIVKYGEPALAAVPDDVLLLDRVANSLLTLGGKENAQKAIRYARTFEDLVDGMPAPQGKDIVQRQEERDRARGRCILFQSRGRTVLGENDEAERQAARSFSVYPNEDSAREWANVLIRMGREQEAVTHLAEAFAVPDSHTTDALRLEDRLRLGQLYSKLNGSEKGLGDLILAAYDRTSTLVETRMKKILALDPNSTMVDPMQFTVTGLDGKKLKLSSLTGKVLVMDFWATWCAPCRVQHPLYEEVKQKFPGRSDLVFLAMDTDDDRSLVEPFLNEQKWDKNVYFDDGLARLLQVSSIPTTVLFDKNGALASRMNGFAAESFVGQITERIRELLDPVPAGR